MADTGIPTMDEIQRNQIEQAERQEQRLVILEQILEPAAKQRLSRLALVKKEKARSVEDSLIRAAMNGRLPGKISEEKLIAMLEGISGNDKETTAEQDATKKGITIQRRKYGIDEDDKDDNDDDLR